jgi:hypothetical protein
MNTSAQVHDFFRKMADGLVLNNKGQESTIDSGRNQKNNRNEQWSNELVVSHASQRAPQRSDYGVGLPPLAHN